MGSLQAGGSPGPEDTVANKRPCRKQGERCGPTSGPLMATCVPTQRTPPPYIPHTHIYISDIHSPGTVSASGRRTESEIFWNLTLKEKKEAGGQRGDLAK